MTDQAPQNKAANAWLAVDPGSQSSKFPYPQFALELAGNRSLYAAVAEGDWLAAANASGGVTRIARVLRVRSDLKTTTFYFDRLQVGEYRINSCCGRTGLTKGRFDVSRCNGATS